ncbi:hypothetical protein [Mucilaginibacter segetis]|uniref:Uncharacterized protein n=1 Tax=Mucilaginibacter segetis TaxID=2793071 RepID=A0A934UM39_9SPHI|nr:hypothetical protein [Mucilaginibacter segetis]MBK0378625.1 hypothetical protein [Mucilaginibacter segetis]
MEKRENKQIGTGKAETTRQNGESLVQVMKPFVKFGVLAVGVLASALITIVKHIPKPDTGHSAKRGKDNRVIKI